MKIVLKYTLVGFTVFAVGALIALLTFTSLPADLWSKLDKSSISSLASRIPRLYIVQSGSMEPTIPTGSIVASMPSDTYVQGDIITFSANNTKTLITHRIVFKNYNGANGPTYLTSGDANEDLDNWELKDEQIVGKNVLTVPYLGYIANFAKTPQGFLLLVIVPATIVIYEELKSLLREIAKMFKRLFSRKSINKNSDIGSNGQKKGVNGLPKASVILPVIGAGLVFVGLTAAYFSDIEESLGNFFQASDDFGNNIQRESTEFLPLQIEEISATLTPTPTSEPDEVPQATGEGELIDE